MTNEDNGNKSKNKMKTSHFDNENCESTSIARNRLKRQSAMRNIIDMTNDKEYFRLYYFLDTIFLATFLDSSSDEDE